MVDWYVVVLTLGVFALSVYLAWPRAFEGPLTPTERRSLGSNKRWLSAIPLLAPILAVAGIWVSLAPKIDLELTSQSRADAGPGPLEPWTRDLLARPRLNVDCLVSDALRRVESQPETDPYDIGTAVVETWSAFQAGEPIDCERQRQGSASRTEVESVELTLVDLASRYYRVRRAVVHAGPRLSVDDPWAPLRALLEARGTQVEIEAEGPAGGLEEGDMLVLRASLDTTGTLLADVAMPCSPNLPSSAMALRLVHRGTQGAQPIECDPIVPLQATGTCPQGFGPRLHLKRLRATGCDLRELREGNGDVVLSIAGSPEHTVKTAWRGAVLQPTSRSQAAWRAIQTNAAAGGIELRLTDAGISALVPPGRADDDVRITLDISEDRTRIQRDTGTCLGHPARLGDGNGPAIQCYADDTRKATCLQISVGSREAVPPLTADPPGLPGTSEIHPYRVDRAMALAWTVRWAADLLASGGPCSDPAFGTSTESRGAGRLLLTAAELDRAIADAERRRAALSFLLLSLAALLLAIGLWRNLALS